MIVSERAVCGLRFSRWQIGMVSRAPLIGGAVLKLISAAIMASAMSVPAVVASERPAKDGDNGIYLERCASCHGMTLGGGFAQALKGEAFRAKWEPKGTNALREYISHAMPPASPGILTPEEYVAVTAFIGRANGLTSEGTSQKHGGEAGGIASEIVNRDAQYLEAMGRRSALISQVRPVDEKMLREPPPEDWLSFRRTDDAHAFSPLSDINRQTAPTIKLVWSLAIPSGTNEITPLVHDGVMYLNSSGTVMAIDVKSSDVLWKFTRPTTLRQLGPPITQARGLAIFGERLYVPTIDNHILALNFRTGQVVWDHAVTGMHNWMRFSASPMVVHGKVIEGATGCWSTGQGGRCFIFALDAVTGNEVWRFHTIPNASDPGGESWNGAPDEQRSGASVWSPGTYDEGTNLIYYGTGQTYHIASLMIPAAKRSLSNSGLYTDSTLALNPDTGKLAWYYQHMARDVWDLDWAFERTLATIDINGRSRRVVMTVGKIGILDVLDAKSGKYLFSYDLGFQNLVTKIDPITGWKTTDPEKEPDPKQPKFVCPFAAGVRNWPGTAYDDAQHLLYVGTSDSCMDIVWSLGEDFDISYNARPRPNGSGDIGGVAAINLETRKLQWNQRRRAPESSAALATAGGILFEGSRDRVFRATDSSTGDVLWSAKLDNVPSAAPITFSTEGKQYVAITTGGGNPNDVIRAFMTPEIDAVAPATTLWVFALGGTP